MSGPGSSVFAWSPLADPAGNPLLATGSAAGSEFQNGGGDPFGPAPTDNAASTASTLGVYRMDVQNGGLEKVSAVDLGQSRFEKVAWGGCCGGMGLIAGAMTDGPLKLWKADDVIKGTATKDPFATISHKSGNITCMDFMTKIEPAVLATGGTGGIAVWELSKPEKPKALNLGQAQQQSMANISDIAFNPKCNHILAHSSLTGSVVVWDLRSCRVSMTLQAQGPYSFTSLAWNPANQLELAVGTQSMMHGGFGGQMSSVIQIWDVRVRSAPHTILEGHTGGVDALSWCGLDKSLLVSSSSDGRQILWNPTTKGTQHPVADLKPHPGRSVTAKWHPSLPLLATGSSTEGSLEVASMHSLSGALAENGSTASVAPGWLKRPCGATFVGGSLVAFTKNPRPQPGQQRPAEGTPQPVLRLLSGLPTSDEKYAEKTAALLALLQGEKDGVAAYCKEQAEARKEDKEAAVVWGVFQTMLEDDPRRALMEYVDGEAVDAGEPEEGNTYTQDEADARAVRALLHGEAVAAHKWLLAGNRVAEALVFACVSREWDAAKEAFYASKAAPPAPSAKLTRIIQSFVEGTDALKALIAAVGEASPILTWKETLSLIAAQAQGEELSPLVMQLAEALATPVDNNKLICVLAAGDVDKVADLLASQVDDTKPETLWAYVAMVQVYQYIAETQCEAETYLDALCAFGSRLAAEGTEGSSQAMTLLWNTAQGWHQGAKELVYRLGIQRRCDESQLVNPFADALDMQYYEEPQQQEAAATADPYAEADTTGQYYDGNQGAWPAQELKQPAMAPTATPERTASVHETYGNYAPPANTPPPQYNPASAGYGAPSGYGAPAAQDNTNAYGSANAAAGNKYTGAASRGNTPNAPGANAYGNAGYGAPAPAAHAPPPGTARSNTPSSAYGAHAAGQPPATGGYGAPPPPAAGGYGGPPAANAHPPAAAPPQYNPPSAAAPAPAAAGGYAAPAPPAAASRGATPTGGADGGLGDTSNVPAESRPLVDLLTSIYQGMQQGDPRSRKAAPTVQKAMAVLFQRLNANLVSQECCTNLNNLAQSAQAMNGEYFDYYLNLLLSTHWEEFKHFSALKHIRQNW